MTILQVIQRSSEFLLKKGVESPRLQGELLLAHALGMPRLNLYLAFDRILVESEIQQIRELVSRRGAREPLQHIIGSTSFCGYEINVNRDVLVPRPETELLAEAAWEYLTELRTRNSGSISALDFGTGSGCLAISIASRFPEVRVWALDISEKALAMARQNTQKNLVQDRVQLVCGDGFRALENTSPFDLIVSNPPYIPSSEIESLEKEVRQFDPILALDGGLDGLDFYRQLAQEGLSFLKPQGRIAVEFGDGQAESISNLFRGTGWQIQEIRRDYSARPRILIAHPPEP